MTYLNNPNLTAEEVQAEMDRIEAEVLTERASPTERAAINNRAKRLEENRVFTAIR